MDVAEEAGPALVDILGTRMEVDDKDDEPWFEDCEGLRPKKNSQKKTKEKRTKIEQANISSISIYFDFILFHL
jgi:hypothetical protein